MFNMILLLIIAILLLIILYLYLHKTNSSNEVKTVIETVKVTDMKIESKSEATIKLDLAPVTEPTDYDEMVGKI